MKSYYRLMLGARSIHANDCFGEEVVGTDFGLTEDLTDKLPEEWRDFNKKFIPTLIQNEPGKSRVSAGLACAAIWTVSKGMKDGDILLSPDGQGRYRFLSSR
jgi:restriction system protein